MTINDVFGPASYVTPAGQPVAAQTLGLRKIYAAFSVGISQDGVNFSEIITPSGNQATTINLRWSVVTTGAEVGAGVNLSTKRVRILAFGV